MIIESHMKTCFALDRSYMNFPWNILVTGGILEQSLISCSTLKVLLICFNLLVKNYINIYNGYGMSKRKMFANNSNEVFVKNSAKTFVNKLNCF